jgi:hypothetical protein
LKQKPSFKSCSSYLLTIPYIKYCSKDRKNIYKNNLLLK